MIRETNFSLKAVFDEISFWVPVGESRTDGQTTVGFWTPSLILTEEFFKVNNCNNHFFGGSFLFPSLPQSKQDKTSSFGQCKCL